MRTRFTTAGEPHKQWVYGIAAIVMTLLTPFTFSVFRLCQNNNYHADKKVAVLVGVTEVAWAGSGLAFKLIADSDIILILSIFVPAIFGLVGVCYFQWILNDYRLFSLKVLSRGNCRCCVWGVCVCVCFGCTGISTHTRTHIHAHTYTHT